MYSRKAFTLIWFSPLTRSSFSVMRKNALLRSAWSKSKILLSSMAPKISYMTSTHDWNDMLMLRLVSAADDSEIFLLSSFAKNFLYKLLRKSSPVASVAFEYFTSSLLMLSIRAAEDPYSFVKIYFPCRCRFPLPLLSGLLGGRHIILKCIHTSMPRPILSATCAPGRWQRRTKLVVLSRVLLGHT